MEINNCRLYSDLSELKRIIIEDNIITDILPSSNFNNNNLNAQGLILAPGFIDVHIQGAGGADILDGNLDSLNIISRTLAKDGTTSFLGTTVVKPEEDNSHLRELKKYVNSELEGARLLGFHLEGPFINLNKKGGLNPSGIYPPSLKAAQEILDILGSSLAMMTIAPELENALETIEYLSSHGVVTSFAHSEAGYKITKKGFIAGIDHVTHIFNAMLPLSHRNPGPIGAIFENKSITAQIISDGHHLHPSIVNMIFQQLGPDRCVCITDAMKSLGLPEGEYEYNGRKYLSKSGAARYYDNTLIGSTTPLNKIAQKFMQFTGCSLKDAIDTISLNPAKVLKIDKKFGKIEKGYIADLVFMNEDFNIEKTIINGKVIG